MKRVLALVVLCFAFLYANADGGCTEMIKKGINRFNEGHYLAAKEYFTYCFHNCPELKELSGQWIKKCEELEKARELQRIAEIKQKKDKELVERRERNRYVYLSVYNDLSGKFSGLKHSLETGIREKDPSVHFTADSLEAYWIIQVTVNMFEEQSFDDYVRYQVNVYIEVYNAAELDYETKLNIVQAEGLFSKTDTESIIANSFYESKNIHVYNEVEAKIRESIGATCLNNTNAYSSIQKHQNVAIYIAASDINSSIAAQLETRLKINFNNSKKLYQVIPLNEKLDQFIDAELKNQVKNVKSKEWNTRGNSLGIDKICFVTIKNTNHILQFICSFVDVSTGVEEKTGFYPNSNHDPTVTTSSDIEKINIVADVLSMSIGLLSDEQIANLKIRIDNVHDKNVAEDQERKRLTSFLSFLPSGWAHKEKGYKVLGYTIMGCEYAAIVGGIFCTVNANYQENIMHDNIHNPNVFNEAKSNYDFSKNLEPIFWYTAGGVYLVNVITGLLLPDRNTDNININAALISNNNNLTPMVSLVYTF